MYLLEYLNQGSIVAENIWRQGIPGVTPWKRIVELITLELYNNHPVNFVVEQTDSTTKKAARQEQPS